MASARRTTPGGGDPAPAARPPDGPPGPGTRDVGRQPGNPGSEPARGGGEGGAARHADGIDLPSTPEAGRAPEARSPRPGAGEDRPWHRDAANEEIVRRLRSVEGHVRGVERMVGEGAYCIDVVNQILAVQRALKKVSALVLDRHLHTCVTTAIRSESPDERERVIDEILDVFEAAGRG